MGWQHARQGLDTAETGGGVAVVVGQIVGLVALVGVVQALTGRLGLQAPIMLLVVGIAGSYIPGLPDYRVDPQLVLVVTLPLLLYAAAFNTSLLAFRANMRAIVLLSVRASEAPPVSVPSHP